MLGPPLPPPPYCPQSSLHPRGEDLSLLPVLFLRVLCSVGTGWATDFPRVTGTGACSPTPAGEAGPHGAGDIPASPFPVRQDDSPHLTPTAHRAWLWFCGAQCDRRASGGLCPSRNSATWSSSRCHSARPRRRSPFRSAFLLLGHLPLRCPRSSEGSL